MKTLSTSDIRSMLEDDLEDIFSTYPELQSVTILVGRTQFRGQPSEAIVNYDDLDLTWEDDSGEHYSYSDTDEHHDLPKIRRIVNELTDIFEEFDHGSQLTNIFGSFPDGKIEITMVDGKIKFQ
jgi:hypothetical protein